MHATDFISGAQKPVILTHKFSYTESRRIVSNVPWSSSFKTICDILPTASNVSYPSLSAHVRGGALRTFPACFIEWRALRAVTSSTATFVLILWCLVWTCADPLVLILGLEATTYRQSCRSKLRMTIPRSLIQMAKALPGCFRWNHWPFALSAAGPKAEPSLLDTASPVGEIGSSFVPSYASLGRVSLKKESAIMVKLTGAL